MNKPGGKTATRYAQALLELAQERDQLPKVAETIAGIAKLVHMSEAFRDFLADPRTTTEQQLRVIEKLFAAKADALTFRFLSFLVNRNKISILPEISENFEALYLTHQGILKVKLTSCQGLTDHQVGEICRKLQRYFQKEIHPEQEREPGLLGGFTIRVGDTVYDFSVQTQLDRFRKAVLAA